MRKSSRLSFSSSSKLNKLLTLLNLAKKTLNEKVLAQAEVKQTLNKKVEPG